MLIAYSIACLCVLLIATAIFCFEDILNYLSPLEVTQLEIIIATPIIAIWLLIGQQISFVELFALPTFSNWFWMSIAGLVSFLGGNYYSLLNIKLTNPSNNSLLSPVITVIACLLAVVFLKENITLIGYIGLLLTVLAVWGYQFRELNISFTKQGFISGWICVGCISLGIITAIIGSKGSSISLFHTLFIRLFAVFVMVILFALFSKQNLMNKAQTLSRKVWLRLIAGIFLQTILGSYCWFIASFAIGISRFQVLIALLPFVVAAINAFVLKRQPLSIRFYITALLAFIGVLLLFWNAVV